MKSIKASSASLLKKMIFTFTLAITVLSFYSFTMSTLRDGFLKQLGITKTMAEEKISQSILDGSMDTYGISVKKILLANRTAVTREILVYTKDYLKSASFKKEYEAIRERGKPAIQKAETPEEFQAKNIANLKKNLSETEASLKKADANLKPVFEKVVAEGKKQLAAAEDPNNKIYERYKKGYPQLVKDYETRNEQQLKRWESKYPADPMQFVKLRLQEFLTITTDVDFDAELVTKNGKQYFVNRDYEKKDSRWKMAFRAGKQVVEPAREFVQQWINEIQ